MNDERDLRQDADPSEAVGVPWINTTIQQRIEWRDGDIVVSVPVKSGTTWTMNIVHQLRSGGDPDLFDVYCGSAVARVRPASEE